MHPQARFAGLRGIGRTDLERAEQAQFQPQSISFRELADLRDALDVRVHIRHELPRFVLAWAILDEEMIERNDQRTRPARLGFFAHLTQTALDTVEGAGHVNHLVGIAQGVEFFVADQDDARLAELETPRAGETRQFGAVDVSGTRAVIAGSSASAISAASSIEHRIKTALACFMALARLPSI